MSDFDTKLLKYRLLGKVSEIKAQGGECILVTLDDGTKPPYEASYEVYIGDNVKDCSYDLNKFFKQLDGRPHIKIIGGKNIKSLDSMFRYCKLRSVDLSEFSPNNLYSMEMVFADSKIDTVNLVNIDTQNVTSMYGMFAEATVLDIDLSKLNTEDVINFDAMFYDADVNDEIDVSSFNTSNAMQMEQMFMFVKQDKLDLSNFDTHKVITMEQMFAQAKIKNLDLSSFDVSNVTDFKQMFHEFKTKELNLSSFKIRKDKEVSTYAMFQYSGIEELITSDERIISAAKEYNGGWDTYINKITPAKC